MVRVLERLELEDQLHSDDEKAGSFGAGAVVVGDGKGTINLIEEEKKEETDKAIAASDFKKDLLVENNGSTFEVSAMKSASIARKETLWANLE